MDCDKVVNLLSEYVDGDLADCHCAELRAHFADCPECLKFFDEFRKTVAWSRDCFKAALETDLPAHARLRIETWVAQYEAETCGEAGSTALSAGDQD